MGSTLKKESRTRKVNKWVVLQKMERKDEACLSSSIEFRLLQSMFSIAAILLGLPLIKCACLFE